MLPPEKALLLGEGERFFCKTPECQVLYFGGEVVIEKSAALVRVGLKETEDPIPLCYCFGFTRADIERDLLNTGTTSIPNLITEKIREGLCECELKNPSGRCCLGEVRRAVALAKQAVTPPQDISPETEHLSK